MQSFDTIIVGAGSAGCTIANRLVSAGRSVLLLEAGPADNNPYVHMPATFIRVIGTSRTWIYQSEPAPEANGRTMFIPQGRTLGGSSSVNAMIYVRGQRQDYDDWAVSGCTGWSFDDVLPYFRRSEANERLAGPLHGADGPLKVSDPRFRHPLSLAFVRAAQETGFAYNSDFNGERQDGVGFYQTTTSGGRRGSTAATYLRAVQGNPKLTIVTDAAVERVIIENRMASGVVWRGKSGERQEARATRGVVLTAGALASPKLLMLSGIGPAGHLAERGIEVVHDAPEVGANYQDHLEVSVYGRAREPISLLGQDRGLKALRNGLEYALFRTGILTSTVVESGGFFDTTGAGRPDLQMHVLPVLVGDADRAPLPGHGISVNPCYLRPKSRGRVRLKGPDPSLPISLESGYLSAQEDVDTLVRGVKLARRILRAPALAKLIEAELLPSAEPEISDADIEAHVRAYGKTVYHPAGTCRMGPDEAAVVDLDLKVRGVERLWVGDLSITPSLVSGNTNAPAIMIGERCADFMLKG